MEVSRQTLLQRLPSVDALLQCPAVQELLAAHGHNPVRDAARDVLKQWRSALSRGDESLSRRLQQGDVLQSLAQQVRDNLAVRFASTLRPVFNLTGTVIHTNLGRALLPESAMDAMLAVAGRPVTLEYDLSLAKRGDRDVHVEALICELTGAEAATVVNNNAAAVLLVLNTLARGREVLISRGELVEIGGSFRIPDVMESAGCCLREVGTTNRTHGKDFEQAIDSETALLMNVHTSNYAIHGFTSSVSLNELADIAHRHQLPMASDLGSGTLLDMRQFGLPRELTAREVLAAGADVVCFSGDKLLGGPQAGIIAGNRSLIERIRRNPLKRALRLDKVMLAALSAVLQLYRDPQRLAQRLPTLRDMTRPIDEIKALGERLLPQVQKQLQGIAKVSLVECRSQIGSGAMPEDLLPSFALQLLPVSQQVSPEQALQQLAQALRQLPVPVVGRLQDGALLLDLRCLQDEAGFIDNLRF